MKRIVMAGLLLASCNAFAINENDIRAGYAEMNRACTQPRASTYGTKENRECSVAVQAVQNNSDQLNRQIADNMVKRDQDRQRIQQEEMWREQVRRGYRY